MVILAEKNYGNIFELFPVYFYEEIAKKWNYILHDSGTDFYLENLVHDFYDSFNIEDIDFALGRIMIHWKGHDIIFGVQEISEITGIAIRNGNQQPGNLEIYRPMMGSRCTTPHDGGLSGHTLYKNVYATCRLLCDNVAPTSHISSFYEDTFHIVHALMTKDRNFYMVRRLFDTIAGVKSSNSTTLKLPCLVTLLCEHILPSVEYSGYLLSRIPLHRVRITAVYHRSINEDWTPRMLDENIHAVEAEMIDDDSFFRQSPPSDLKEFQNRTWEGMQRLWGQVSKIGKKIDRLVDSLSCKAGPDVVARSRSRSRNLPRSRSVAGEGSSSRF